MPDSFTERLAAVRNRIEEACARAGRRPDDVLLLPVTKGVAPERLEEAAACGLSVFGENRVQEARQKMAVLPDRLSWHMIGHLQSNKARDAARYFSMIQSVDSLKLLRTIDAAAADEGKTMPVCLEVNLAGEGSKFGLAEPDVAGVLAGCNELRCVDVRGLMAIPPVAEDPAAARPYFAKLRGIRDRLRSESGFELPELSMGMSNDFEMAIEEGATIVRLGTILFGRREAGIK